MIVKKKLKVFLIIFGDKWTLEEEKECLYYYFKTCLREICKNSFASGIMMNHIVFCVDNGWIKQCGVTIKSILFYNPSSEFTFHVLGKEITAENKSLLQKVLNENSRGGVHQ